MKGKKEKVQEDNKKYGAEVNVEKVEKDAKVIVTIDLNKITEEQAKEFFNDIKVKHKDGKALYKDIEENILKNKGIEKVK
ncbi:hypothetical protein [Helcococcus bovis]